MLLPHGTVIAIVDGEKFNLFRNVGTEAAPDLAELDSPKLDSHNHSGSSHHSSSGNHDSTLVAEDAHAIAATEWLNSQVLGHKIEHLVVIAPPRTLGEMRPHYHKLTERALLTELAKDLSGHKGSEILAALKS